jgi:hypothetical protein
MQRVMLVDPALIQRIEEAIAAERSAFADGMATLRPESGASWLPVAGGGPSDLHWGRLLLKPGHGHGAERTCQPRRRRARRDFLR